MRKEVSGTTKSHPEEGPGKHPIHLNDDDIRQFLIDSHPDLQDDPLDSPMAQNAGAVIILLVQSRAETNLADPTRCQKSCNLSVYWKLFVQKRILGFEQELFPLLNWKRIRT
jgi:hypothetical protein